MSLTGKVQKFVSNYGPDDPDRYNTLLSFPRTSKFWLKSDKTIANKYQKPVALIERLLRMGWKGKDKLVVDITCGTGTTTVSL